MIGQGLIGRLNPQWLIHLAFRARAGSEFVICQGQRLTRGQVYAMIRRLAAGLQALGVGPGDRVATLLPGCPEAVYAMFLPPLLGTIHVPLNPLLGEYELRHILADCSAKVVIVSRRWLGLDHPALLARLLPDLPDLRCVLVRDATDGDGKVFRPLAEVLSLDHSLRPAKISAQDVSLIPYTAGTTGQPKGVVHKRALAPLVRMGGARLSRSPLRCLLLPYPPYHYAGMFGIAALLLAGGKVILMERFDPEQALEQIQTERVSQIGGTPTMYRWLLATPGQERYDLSSVQRVTSSSEPMPLDLARALHERLGCSVENIYGTTESSVISWTDMHDSWERAATTVGRPAPGVEVRIVDDARQPLPAAAQGEIAVRSPHVMLGYYRDPALTAQALDADGWFYTGDVGALDDDGYLRLVDRKKDLIIRGGQNISPAEVEAFLERHPLIRRAAVVAAPAGIGAEEVWAYLEPQPGARLTAMEVLGFCRGQIAAFKIPDAVRFVERLPTTSTGKVQKFKLRESAAQEAKADGAA